jgi:hypothetical protein
LGIVGDGRADADNDDVHQGPQPMQMHESRGPVNVFRMAGLSRNPAVKRLAELANDQTIVHGSLPQRTEHVRPALREWLVLSTEYIAEVFPWIGRRRLAQGEIGYRHAEIKNPVWWSEQPDYVPSCRKSHLFATGMIPACAWIDRHVRG